MIDSIMKLIRKDRVEAEGLDIFTGLLLSSTLSRTIAGIDRAALAAFAQQAFRHLVRKPHKRHAIDFSTTSLLASGPPLTVLEILNDDMPFLVESVIGELHAQGLVPRLVFHPIFKVKRYGSGRLQAVVGPGDRHWSAGDQESYVAALLDPLDEASRQRLSAALERTLDDVRAAATDAEAMRNRVTNAIGTYEAIQLSLTPAAGAPGPLELKEAAQFLRWLGQGNFTLLGAADYEIVGIDGKADLWPAAQGALGIARMERDAETAMTPALREVYGAPTPLIFSKSRHVSRVRSRVPLDRIGVKRYTAAGNLIGELRLYGQFTPASYVQPVETVPVVRHKVRAVLAEARFPPDSHNGRTLIDILEAFPRDELLQITEPLLFDWSMRLLDLAIRPRAAVLTRHDALGGYSSAFVYVPREHYTSLVRERIAAFIADRLGGTVEAFSPHIGASPLVRLHLIIAGARPIEAGDDEALAAGVADIVKTWDERLSEELAARLGAGSGAAAAIYEGAFGAGYMERFPPSRAVEDIARIERLGPGQPVAIDFYRPPGEAQHRLRAALYRYDQPIALSERVPILENMGLKVIDERTYRIRPAANDGTRAHVVLHDMELETADGTPLDLARHEARMEDTFLAVLASEIDSDPFNGLVIAAGLDWREAAVLRALAVHMRQTRAPFSLRYVAETLMRHPGIAANMIAIFRQRFDHTAPSAPAAREEAVAGLREAIDAALAAVAVLDEDRILRRLLSVLLAIVRTNAFVRDAEGRAPPLLAFKLASREIDRMPEPKPYREIFVYSPRVEGVHLRFAPIARGGIRWSDRLQDYRTEILGLAKAQQVKNAVIVPSGAKGGFVPKQIRRAATRDEVQAEGVACYRLFVEALLSLTDDIRDGVVVPPSRVIRRDGDDPYLVVAADKGTATFSDYANAISLERGFWLGDAFASGGATGYDHKRLGITARGAWECVRRQFREMDTDIQREPFTVVGVGDMSGDVFGNAMLLSPAIRLVAAFDHRDIFLDPSPDGVDSFAERKRLFELPRSSWAEYDRTKLSPGGGVFSRSAKSIPLSPQVRTLLDLEANETTPAELVQAILRARVDLLWFGGIGTFVRETGETDDQVGDRANDALRITAAELRAKVIGEGANLGMTQRARIEAARRGVRLDTDFIDNSAGVNTSDKEVNIKIALEPALIQGRLSRDDRNRLMATMSTHVAGSVLANNRAQALALSLAERASRRDLGGFVQLTRDLEERGLTDRKLEALPSGAEFAARAAAGSGLTRPELAVLLSWAKIALNADILASTLPDGPAATGLFDYFPPALRDEHKREIAGHRLRREIVATGLTNAIVNRGGPDIVVGLAAAAPGEPVAGLVEVYLAACEIVGLDGAWKEADALDGRVPGGVQLALFEGLQSAARREALRLLAVRRGREPAELTALYAPAAASLIEDPLAIMPARQRSELEQEAQRLQSVGVPRGLAERHVTRDLLARCMVMSDEALALGTPVRELARVRLARDEYLFLDEVRARAAAIQPADAYESRIVASAMVLVEKAATAVGERMLADPAARGRSIDAWALECQPALSAAHPVIAEALALPGLSVARLAVIAECVRGLAEP